MVPQRLDPEMTTAKNSQTVEGAAATEQDGSSSPEATVVEPVAAMPVSTYPTYDENGNVVVEEPEPDQGLDLEQQKKDNDEENERRQKEAQRQQAEAKKQAETRQEQLDKQA